MATIHLPNPSLIGSSVSLSTTTRELLVELKHMTSGRGPSYPEASSSKACRQEGGEEEGGEEDEGVVEYGQREVCRISPFDVRTCKRQPEVPKSKPALIIKGKVIVGRERSERRTRRDDMRKDDSCRGLKVVSVRITCRNFVEYSLL
jgi:hypothetical protein